MIPEISLPGLKPGEKIEPKEVAAKVQAMFTEVMLKAIEDNVEAEDGLFGSSSSEILRGMLREQLATTMSGQLKTQLEEQLQKKVEPASPKSERV